MTVVIDAYKAELDQPGLIRCPTPPSKSATSEDHIRNTVRRILCDTPKVTSGLERRRDRRYPYPQLIVVQPLDKNGNVMEDAQVTVVGKHLSERGLGFFHEAPLPYRKVRVQLQNARAETAELVLDITWCRFTKQGWYESGGRFLELCQALGEGQAQGA